VTLPRLLVLTDRHRCAAAGRTLLVTVTDALDAGAPAIVLREKDLPSDQRHVLASDIADAVRAHDATLIVASDAELATAVGASGVHLAAHDPPVETPTLTVGRSCHDAAEVRAAARQRTDHLTLSPVAASTSKPGYGPALGREGLADLVAEAPGIPAYALGGVTAEDVHTWLDAGAHGVAVMGAVMGAADPGACVRKLLARLPEDPA
jgi:thiamine-phosphate pyrophosphorylase